MGEILGSPRVASLLFASSYNRLAEFRAICFYGPSCSAFANPKTFVHAAKWSAHRKMVRFTIQVHGGASIRQNHVHNMSDAIIPALKHRTEEGRVGKECLGESSTRMGDILGSPCVASLLFASSYNRLAEFRAICFYGTSCSAFANPKTFVHAAKWSAHRKMVRFTIQVRGGASIRQNHVHNMSDAIIPALKHRIPSELRS